MIIFISPNGELVETKLKTHYEYLKANNLKMDDMISMGYIQCNNLPQETYIKFNRFQKPAQEQIKGIEQFLKTINKRFQVMYYPYACGVFYESTISAEKLVNNYYE